MSRPRVRQASRTRARARGRSEATRRVALLLAAVVIAAVTAGPAAATGADLQFIRPPVIPLADQNGPKLGPDGIWRSTNAR